MDFMVLCPDNIHSLSIGSRVMITTSEIAATVTIWVLTAVGTFFGGRAAWRRRTEKLKTVRTKEPQKNV
jgi:hypothetical protein